MKMGHVTELLSAYLDEQVSSGERARITTHLEACESCRAHLEALRKTVALLHTTEPVRAPEGFRARLRERIDAQPRRAPRTFGLPRLPWSWRIERMTASLWARPPRRGRCCEKETPGTRVAIGENSPRISLGADGLGSKVS